MRKTVIIPVYVALGALLVVAAYRAIVPRGVETLTIPRPENVHLDPHFRALRTDFSKRSVELSEFLDGGPGKDGIPAITNPQFVSAGESQVADDVPGILVSFEGEERFYPYTIMLWHEIVNDEIGNTTFATTFCPLCGSAIVFNRIVGGEELTFKVSGLLYESNLVMYDTKTESLWSQAKGEAIAGDYTGTKLEYLPVQVPTMGEVRQKHPSAKVLSEDTGYSRRYGVNPYSGYAETEELYFPVSHRDTRFPLKEIMYVIPYREKSIAMPHLKLKPGTQASFAFGDETLTAEKTNGKITVTNASGEHLPGYYEMWFSWAVHHEKNGMVWEL